MVELDFDLFYYFSFNIYSGERHVFIKLFLTFFGIIFNDSKVSENA